LACDKQILTALFLRTDEIVVVWGVTLETGGQPAAFGYREWLLNILTIEDKGNRVISEQV
jgi:hypothetical protein